MIPRATLIDAPPAQERRSRQRIDLVLLLLELGARAGHDVRRNVEAPDERPGRHDVEVGLGRPVRQHDQEIIIAVWTGSPLGTAPEQPDLLGREARDDPRKEQLQGSHPPWAAPAGSYIALGVGACAREERLDAKSRCPKVEVHRIEIGPSNAQHLDHVAPLLVRDMTALAVARAACAVSYLPGS
jgi:hypothetical protein